MVDIVTVTATIASVATLLMVLAMLWFVWQALGEETHRPNGGDEELV